MNRTNRGVTGSEELRPVGEPAQNAGPYRCAPEVTQLLQSPPPPWKSPWENPDHPGGHSAVNDLSGIHIKRLRGLEQPECRLRVDDVRCSMPSGKAKSMSSGPSRRGTRRTGSIATAPGTRRVALAEMKDQFSRYLKRAASKEILITRRGRPAGLLIGFGLMTTRRTTRAEGLPTRGVARQNGDPCWLRR